MGRRALIGRDGAMAAIVFPKLPGSWQPFLPTVPKGRALRIAWPDGAVAATCRLVGRID